MKIVLLPLDERPCNAIYPQKLFSNLDCQIVCPKEDILGNKKQSANIEKIIEFLLKECANADGVVLSLDMLLYGGLLPSRLHFYAQNEVQQRLEVLKKLKEINSKLKIYAFQVIMRCPKYSSSDEEPDYYEICGEQIHKIGRITHLKKLKLVDEATADQEISYLKTIAKEEFLEDYVSRRKFNLEFNVKTLDLLQDGTIDFLIIPQDDAAEYGYTATDQKNVRIHIKEKKLQFKVLMYPGADEIALTLMSKLKNEILDLKPKVFVKYASVKSAFIVPSYEDRMLGETIKYHIIASGCQLVSSESECDFVFAITSPSGKMGEAVFQADCGMNYDVDRNLTEFVLKIEDYVNADMIVTVGDNAFANGGDLEFVSMLENKNLLFRICGYAGWNTSSNTLGTAMAMGVVAFHSKVQGDKNIRKQMQHSLKKFLAERYVEDVGYCSVVRKKVASEYVEKLGYNYFFVEEKKGKISKIVEDELNDFVNSHLPSIRKQIEIENVYMPWRRMFEIGIDCNLKNEDSGGSK